MALTGTAGWACGADVPQWWQRSTGIRSAVPAAAGRRTSRNDTSPAPASSPAEISSAVR